MPTYRTGRSRGVGADLELVLQQVLESAVVHRDQHQVRGLTADLEPPRSAGHANEYRRAPAVTGAARDDSLPVLRPEYEGALDHSGHHAHARGPLQDVHRHTVILGAHHLVENHFRRIDAGLQISTGGGCTAGASKHETEGD